MNAWFADSFFWIALLARDDKAHSRAAGIIKTLDRPIVTTAWALTEVADAFAPARTRSRFARLLALLSGNPEVTIVPADGQSFDDGVKLYLDRPDKDWSLTDCISFVIMAKFGLSDALTGDHHFEQAGFVAAMK